MDAHPSPPTGIRLLARVRAAIRLRHFSRRTEKADVAWVRRYVLFRGKRHPVDLSEVEVITLLSALAGCGLSAAGQ